MGLFDRFRSKNYEAASILNWKSIDSESKLHELIEQSSTKPQIIFKHSSSCGISFFAKKSLDSVEILENENFDAYLVDVIRERAISLKIEELTGIRHESPQILLFKNGEVIWDASHNSVRSEKILKVIEEI